MKYLTIPSITVKHLISKTPFLILFGTFEKDYFLQKFFFKRFEGFKLYDPLGNMIFDKKEVTPQKVLILFN